MAYFTLSLFIVWTIIMAVVVHTDETDAIYYKFICVMLYLTYGLSALQILILKGAL
jgi:hypothetical protein